jgi:2-amino-4-hydroxy-6-hydroxymethyldihydropteridine diphosphokinase
MNNHTVYISVGSNLGSKLENCQKGVEALIRSGSAVLIKQSGIYKTDPVGYKDQDWFVNYVIKIETDLDPFQLLRELKYIQRKAGRVHDPVRYGPRILDLDIILYDDFVINSAKLTIPHPRMHKRRFVLKPICDIDPQIVHPVIEKKMQYLLETLNDIEQGLEPYPCDS